MGERIGVIAGGGQFPLLAIQAAKTEGFSCIVAGLRGEALPDIEGGAEIVEWFTAGELGRVTAFFKENRVRRVLLAGKFDPRAVFTVKTADPASLALLAKAPDRTPSGLIGALIGYLAVQGLSVIDPQSWLAPHFCPSGILAGPAPTAPILADIAFGWARARRVADEDIGQTLVVKDRVVVAVEGLEGTDEAVKRAGRLAGPGLVVLKIARTHQDMRVDVPAVGAETLRSLIRVGAAALCIEAGRVAFFEREESLALAEANHISVLARQD